MTGKVLILGARGFVGTHLAHALQRSGARVRCSSRQPEKAAAQHPEFDWVFADVEDPESLERAFTGVEAVVYLVHQMRSSGCDLVQQEIRSARNVLDAADRHGVRRLVYLGGPSPESGQPSAHLEARLRTGEVLRSGATSTIELRASMIIGPGSESWWIVRDLALRLPVMVLPSWLRSRTQPVFIDDVVRALVRALELPHEGSAAYDLPGPEVLTGREILQRVAAVGGLRPWMVDVPMLTPSLSSHWIRLVTRADYRIARKLVDGLTADLVAADDGFWALAPELHRTAFDEAVRVALGMEDAAAASVTGKVLERVAQRFAWAGN